MGVAPSALSQTEDPKKDPAAPSPVANKGAAKTPAPEKELVLIDSQLQDNVRAVSDIVSAYSQNNPARLKEILVKADTDPTIIDLLNKSVDMHNQLFKSAGLTPPTEKDGPLSDDRLRQIISQFSNKETNDKAADILKSKFFASNPEWKKMVEHIFDNMAKLQTKARFFEYKYNQLNIILVGLTRHVSSVMRKFMGNTIAYVELRDRMYSTTVAATIKLLDDVSVQSGTSKDVENARRVQAAMQDLQRLVSSNQGELTSFLNNYKRNSISEIVDFIQESEKGMRAPPPPPNASRLGDFEADEDAPLPRKERDFGGPGRGAAQKGPRAPRPPRDKAPFPRSEDGRPPRDPRPPRGDEGPRPVRPPPNNFIDREPRRPPFENNDDAPRPFGDMRKPPPPGPAAPGAAGPGAAGPGAAAPGPAGPAAAPGPFANDNT